MNFEDCEFEINKDELWMYNVEKAFLSFLFLPGKLIHKIKSLSWIIENFINKTIWILSGKPFYDSVSFICEKCGTSTRFKRIPTFIVKDTVVLLTICPNCIERDVRTIKKSKEE